MSSEGERPEGGSEERDSFEGDGSEENRSIRIGSVSGAVAIGDHNTVVGSAGSGTQNPAALELLSAIRELRGDLARLMATDGLMALDAELADTEEEITRYGGISPSRLHRLRVGFTAEQAFLGRLASAGAVAVLLDDAVQDSSRETPIRPMPSGAGPRDAPTGHTPPGPSPGSDDDEWPETDG
ncbi:hypothetical protein [Streptomyces lunalinharesii]|uniref:Uncharacterized protein n=1 Tax=Streptomyces lunalinharesii TaxID=333384 RepID=A0ABN3T4L7_9ACTN